MLQDILQGAFELFFPDNCLLCRRFLNSRHARQLCACCLGSLTLDHRNTRCWETQHRVLDRSLAFDQAWSVCLYNETAQKLLHAFKYSSKTSLCKTFVPVMTDFIDHHHVPLRTFDWVSPIPLHPVRLRERGYNQSALLSNGLSRHYGVSHKEDLLVRQKQTRTQTELGARQRWTNMEAAFRIKNPAEINGKSVLLVDDLYTTGATVHHAALALKTAGALRVGVLTFSMTAK